MSRDAASAKAQAGETPPPEPSKTISLSADEHAQLKQQADEAASAKDRYLRTLAEFDNAKKRLDRDREEFVKYAAERLVRSLLPILDSFEHALKSMDGSMPEAARAGVQLIFRQLTEALQKEGVARIEAVGAPFDHHRHEAVQQVERTDVPDHTVVEEVQAGYTLHGRLLRPALVKVATTPHNHSQTDVAV